MICAREQIRKRTKTISFKRQLWPPPPIDARPYWWGINTLSFYKDREKVWEQKIPETAPKLMVVNRFGYETIDHPGYGFKVELDPNFGWCLVFEMRHQQAEKVWGFISERDNFYNLFEEEIQDSLGSAT